MWRVDRVLQMRRQRVKVIQVMGPLVALLATVTLLLLWWTLKDPWVWHREPISMSPPITYGECSSESFAKFFVPLVGIKLIALALALRIGWKTMDVQDSLSHARAVFSATWTHMQAWFIGLPILFAIGGDSADATYLGRVLLIWIFGVSTTAIVVCPKLYQVWLQKRHPDARSSMPGKRVHISGLNFQPASNGSQSSPPLSQKGAAESRKCEGAPHPSDSSHLKLEPDAEPGVGPAAPVAMDAPLKTTADAQEQSLDVPSQSIDGLEQPV